MAEVSDGRTEALVKDQVNAVAVDFDFNDNLDELNSNPNNHILPKKIAICIAFYFKNEKIECTYKNLDRYGRILGICGDINGKMVEFGHAVAYVRYSKKYLPLQRKAKNEKRGIWSGKFDMPEDWRRKYK